jgi:hypothetical protein
VNNKDLLSSYLHDLKVDELEDPMENDSHGWEETGNCSKRFQDIV